MRRKFRITMMAAAAAAMSLAAIGTSGTAHANTDQGLIFGTGTVTGDWGDEGPLSTTSYAHSDAVGVWQAVLWADGYMANWSDIDCRFGPATRTATIAWQKDHGLTGDGALGLGRRGLHTRPVRPVLSEPGQGRGCGSAGC